VLLSPQSSIDRFPQQLPQGVHTHTLPEEFIVERSVWKTGRNEIKIMDRNRKALSIKKADLDAINKVRLGFPAPSCTCLTLSHSRLLRKVLGDLSSQPHGMLMCSISTIKSITLPWS